jgi:hypothetical protein
MTRAMAPERGSETQTLSERIDRFRTHLPFTLTLDRELEASFQSSRVASRAMQAFWAALIAIVGYNLLFAGNVLGGQMIAELTGRAFAIDLAVRLSHGDVATEPGCAAARYIAARRIRFRDPWLHIDQPLHDGGVAHF